MPTTSTSKTRTRASAVKTRFGRASSSHSRQRDRCGNGRLPVEFPFMNVETGTQLVLQPIMPLDLPVKVRSWELTVYPVHLKPYWGKPAVRNFRGGRGNPKLNRARRAPLPYSALILLLGAQRTSSREAFMARNFREKLNRKLDLLCAPSSSCVPVSASWPRPRRCAARRGWAAAPASTSSLAFPGGARAGCQTFDRHPRTTSAADQNPCLMIEEPHTIGASEYGW